MKKSKWYHKYANIDQACLNCIEAENLEWQEKHTETLEQLILLLPHGSGIDSDWYQLDTDPKKCLKFSNSYHVMNENGYYDGWIDFTATIKPSLVFEMDLIITGKFGNRQDLKLYLEDILYDGFTQMV